jgi:hypothetical protein
VVRLQSVSDLYTLKVVHLYKAAYQSTVSFYKIIERDNSRSCSNQSPISSEQIAWSRELLIKFSLYIDKVFILSLSLYVT